MPYNPENNPYIPGDPYSYDLKWVVEEIKHAIELYTPLHDEFTELSGDFTELHDYVMNYFAQLDLTQEVSDKLDEMAADGSLDAIILPYFNAYKDEIDQEIVAQNNTIATVNSGLGTLTARVNEITNLPEGSTAGDAELQDIRIGADGKTYDNAGNAVRGQYANLEAADLKAFKLVVDAAAEWEQGSIGDNGALNNSTTRCRSHSLRYHDNAARIHLTITAGYKVRVEEYRTQSVYTGSYLQRVFPLTSQPISFTPVTGHRYVIVIGATDDAAITPETLPADVVHVEIYEATDTTLTMSGIPADAKIIGDYATAQTQLDERMTAAMQPLILAYTAGGITDAGIPVSISTTRIRCGLTASAPLVRTGDFFVCDPLFKFRIGLYNSREIESASFVRWATGGSYQSGTYVFTAADVGLYAVPLMCDSTDDTTDITGYVTTMNDYAKYFSYAAQMEFLYNAAKPIAGLSCFGKIGVCGASFDSGFYHANGHTYEDEKLSWVAALARRNGADYGIYAHAAVTTKTWLTDPLCLAKMLADTPCNLYIMTFVGNDSHHGASYLGSLSDYDSGDFTQYPDTYYGNYGRIIEMTLEHAPKALIVISGAYWATWHDQNRRTYFKAAQEIADHYGLPFIDMCADPNFEPLTDYNVGSHLTPIITPGRAVMFEHLFNLCVINNYSYFKNYNPPV